MKFQFGIASCLLAMTFIAIGLAGGIASLRQFWSPSLGLALGVSSGPLWVPFIFASYAIGNKRLTVPTVIAFAFAEVLAFVACIPATSYIMAD